MRTLAIVGLIITSLMLKNAIVFGQSDSTAYSSNFVFKEGIYLNYWQFKLNRPILKKYIKSDYDKNKLDFLNYVVSKNEIVYLDSINVEHTMITKNIWGYCQNQTIYINFWNDFNRIMVLGNVCHFIAYQISSMGYMGPGFIDPMVNYPTTFKEMKQLLFDTETAQIMPFNVESVETILSRDKNLFDEFNTLKKRKKRESIFLYLRKYNEKHPLYFMKN